eukprot:TRINITY_DN399_c0_g1_i2.p1 TRINITY_DN399_c0_g1~~TRINITY_DN399_c0_g1_i2.p1  ORF type:complete len:172 (+),score=8.56 TRINITY_DN399_c0_g1_i2:303-818(+)
MESSSASGAWPGFFAQCIGGVNSLRSMVPDPVIIKVTVFLQICCCVVLIALAVVANSYTGFDSVGFYVAHLVMCLFGLYAIFTAKRKFLVVYLISLMIMCLLTSIGYFFFSHEIDLLNTKCQLLNDCADVSALNNNRSRNISLVVIEMVALHPTTSYIIYLFTVKTDSNKK